MNEKTKRFLIPAGIVAILVAIWYYLKGSGVPQQVSYPNAEAGGLPAYQSAGNAYNFGVNQPGPSPALIYGPPPALPPTPNYQRYNYSPLNIFNLTPQAAAAARVPGDNATDPVSLAKQVSKTEDCCGCDCGCPKESKYQFDDGNNLVGVVANPSEQVRAANGQLYARLKFNIDSSVAADDNLMAGIADAAISQYQSDRHLTF